MNPILRPNYKIHVLLLLLALLQSITHAQQPPSPGALTAVPQASAEATKAEPSASVKAPVFSFLEWKSLRVHEAQKKLESMGKGTPPQGTVWQEGKSLSEGEDSARPSEQKLNFNIDVALQLNIHDYFSMYLKTLTPEEFKEATKKLSEDEKSELLLAYKNSTEKEKKIPLKFSKIPKDNAKSKNSEIQ